MDDCTLVAYSDMANREGVSAFLDTHDRWPINHPVSAGMGSTVSREVTNLEHDAKITEIAVVALQAIAAFAAVGIFMIQVRAYSDSKKKRKGKK